MPCPTSRSALRFSLHAICATHSLHSPAEGVRPAPNAQRPTRFVASSHGGDFTASARARDRLAPSLSRPRLHKRLCRIVPPAVLLARAALPLSRLVFAAGPLRSAFPSVGHNDSAPVAAIKGSRQQAVMPLEAGASRAAPDSARSTLAVTAFRCPPFGWASRVRQPRADELRCPLRKGDSFGTEKVTASVAGTEVGQQKKGKTMTKAKPTSEVRIGKLKAAIWANETETAFGTTSPSAALQGRRGLETHQEFWPRGSPDASQAGRTRCIPLSYQQLPEPEEEAAA